MYCNYGAPRLRDACALERDSCQLHAMSASPQEVSQVNRRELHRRGAAGARLYSITMFDGDLAAPRS